MLRDRKILVTGADGDGVGAGVCKAIVEAGGIPVMNARSLEAAELACTRFAGAIPAVADIAKEQEVLAMFADLKERGRLDGLVNNAGVGLCCPSYEATSEQFDHLFNIDVRGLWLVSRSFVNQCRECRTPGSVVNISSVHTKASIANYSIYAAAKGAVEAYTRTSALEFATFGIRVNAVSPGYVHSAQNLDLIGNWALDPQQWVDAHSDRYQALSGVVSAVECGRAAVFFLSDLASAITGQNLYVDKGTTGLLYDNHYIPKKGKWTPEGIVGNGRNDEN
jgi:NAD(P)-dependent dehydrogenase (short-subunit alcohol dehydrogenase family)